MIDDRLKQAVYNNAVWCDTVCRAHDRPGEFLKDMWINRRPTPRFYPNAVTLSAGEGATAQLEYIHNLIEAQLPAGWGVKDSYGTLDLAPLGFQMAHEANWLWRPAAWPKPRGEIAGIRWGRVGSPAELADWEIAWNGEPADKLPTSAACIFPSALLAADGVVFLAAYRGQRIVAGAIANRTREVVGVSNVFVPADALARFWAACVASVIEAFPGLTLVSYEMGRELAAAQSLGFDSLGPLRIWVMG